MTDADHKAVATYVRPQLVVIGDMLDLTHAGTQGSCEALSTTGKSCTTVVGGSTAKRK